MRPAFKITANNQDITAAISKRLVSLRISDESGLTSDTLELVIADDSSAPVAIPSTGAELRAYLGYGAELQDMGLFVADEVALQGWPATMTIRARAAVFDETSGGKKSLASQKTRSWPQGTKLGAMAATIAKEHGLKLSISAELRDIALPHTDQAHESDMNMLTRLARQYDAIAKPAGGALVLVKRGASATPDGKPLPTVSVVGSEVAAYSLELASRESPGTVAAHWWNRGMAKKRWVQVGSGEPVRNLKHAYRNEAQARAAAQAEYDRRQRSQQRLSLTVPGRPALTADGRLQVSQVRPGVDGEWLVTSVVHSLTPSGGYQCELQCESPPE